jgi:RNA polymerase sigma-70 factor (ECF subfamily)
MERCARTMLGGASLGAVSLKNERESICHSCFVTYFDSLQLDCKISLPSARFMQMAAEMPLHSPVHAGDFLTQYRPALISFFRRRCKNLALAEDLAQDVIVRTLDRKWANEEEAKGYVFRTAANLWCDKARREIALGGTELRWDENIVQGVSGGIPLERVLLSEEELHRVDAALLQLGERTRDIFVLNRLEQMKNHEIAAMLGISESAVEKHMTKALAHLARQFSDHEPV